MEITVTDSTTFLTLQENLQIFYAVYILYIGILGTITVIYETLQY